MTSQKKLKIFGWNAKFVKPNGSRAFLKYKLEGPKLPPPPHIAQYLSPLPNY